MVAQKQIVFSTLVALISVTSSIFVDLSEFDCNSYEFDNTNVGDSIFETDLSSELCHKLLQRYLPYFPREMAYYRTNGINLSLGPCMINKVPLDFAMRQCNDMYSVPVDNTDVIYAADGSYLVYLDIKNDTVQFVVLPNDLTLINKIVRGLKFTTGTIYTIIGRYMRLRSITRNMLMYDPLNMLEQNDTLHVIGDKDETFVTLLYDYIWYYDSKPDFSIHYEQRQITPTRHCVTLDSYVPDCSFVHKLEFLYAGQTPNCSEGVGRVFEFNLLSAGNLTVDSVNKYCNYTNETTGIFSSMWRKTNIVIPKLEKQVFGFDLEGSCGAMSNPESKLFVYTTEGLYEAVMAKYTLDEYIEAMMVGLPFCFKHKTKSMESIIRHKACLRGYECYTVSDADDISYSEGCLNHVHFKFERDAYDSNEGAESFSYEGEDCMDLPEELYGPISVSVDKGYQFLNEVKPEQVEECLQINYTQTFSEQDLSVFMGESCVFIFGGPYSKVIETLCVRLGSKCIHATEFIYDRDLFSELVVTLREGYHKSFGKAISMIESNSGTLGTISLHCNLDMTIAFYTMLTNNSVPEKTCLCMQNLAHLFEGIESFECHQSSFDESYTFSTNMSSDMFFNPRALDLINALYTRKDYAKFAVDVQSYSRNFISIEDTFANMANVKTVVNKQYVKRVEKALFTLGTYITGIDMISNIVNAYTLFA